MDDVPIFFLKCYVIYSYEAHTNNKLLQLERFIICYLYSLTFIHSKYAVIGVSLNEAIVIPTLPSGRP